MLSSADFDASAAFWAALGFAETARYDTRYLILRRDGVELHFAPPEGGGRAAYVRVLNIAGLARAVRALNLAETGRPAHWPFQLRPWGMIEGVVIDPDDNMVTFAAADERTDP